MKMWRSSRLPAISRVRGAPRATPSARGIPLLPIRVAFAVVSCSISVIGFGRMGSELSNRRDFLRLCVAVAGACTALPSGAGVGQVSAEYPRLRPQRAIFDASFAAGRSFGHAARALGMTTQAISGDITALWYDDLYFCWQKGSAVIAGLTGASALFCLEELAWDAGHCVVLRVDHTRSGDGGVRHAFRGAAELLQPRVIEGISRDSDWGAETARLAMYCPARSRGCTTRVLAGVSDRSLPWSEQLVSWLIAPRSVDYLSRPHRAS